MKKTISLIAGLAFLFVLLGLVSPAMAESELDFKLVNKTGYAIKKVFIGPSSSDEWGSNVIKGGLDDGESADITFSSGAKAKKWDLKIEWADGGETDEWHGYKLAEIVKITLYYNRKTDTTTAKVEEAE